MKKSAIFPTTLAVLFLATIIFSLTQCTGSGVGQAPASKAEVDSLRAQITQLTATNETIAKNLAEFDTLDFTVFSNQEWARLHESHAQNIKVYWPDGHMTEGIDVHIEDLKKLFVHAPDTRIKEHPIRFGAGNYTAVSGVFEGTFSKPMPIGGGKFIQPTGKSFKMPMATIGIWKDGAMVEEHLFWDNQTYMNQIGLSN
ncbi:MAG: ester cyclase [Saprospiraceae bacterium]|nr:ester cyclase [Saprospiraceae bacterium]